MSLDEKDLPPISSGPSQSEHGPAGGWGSMKGIASVFGKEWNRPSVLPELARINKPDGFACVSCAWGKPAKPLPFEFCENGAKATLWEITPKRCTPDFFAQHSVTELRGWSDHALEHEGRLTHPMRYDPATDHYLPCDWDEAFAAIGSELRAIDPEAAVFYASGRASLETSYLYALFARAYGHNNLPDSSNMCHETTSVALQKLIGAPVGTCTFDDFEHCDAIFFFGQNTGSNSPRFLHPLKDAVLRGCRIVTFNPIREPGLIEFVDPQSPLQMTVAAPTKMSSQYHQVKAGGDIAAIVGMMKHILAADDAKWAAHKVHVIDVDFIRQHTEGFDELAAKVRETGWDEIERESGLERSALEAAADVYIAAERSIGIWGMGLTQHFHGFDNIAMVVNLMLMKGNIGRQGTGVSPVRGHSNVQGQRTVGITEKPELVPNDRLRELYGFDPPMDEGHTTVTACQGIIDGSVRAFIGLGGNFIRAVPEQRRMEAAWPNMRLTVQIATKLNRGHLINGEIAYLLPCLGRIERDVQAGVDQVVSIEDSLSCIHASRGRHKPASEHLRSETAIVCALAQATLGDANPKLAWREWAADYSTVRTAISRTYPEIFHDYETRMRAPGGFHKGNSARERVWKTDGGKAVFTAPTRLSALGVGDAPGRFRLMTLRSNDQFNTTIYGYEDRFRGISGTRDILFINPADIARQGLHEGQIVALVSDAEDGEERRVDGLTVTPFAVPEGCLGGYYPELNPLVPLWYHDQASKTPAAKGVPVRIVAN